MIFNLFLDVPVIKRVTLQENSRESWHDFKTLSNHLYIITLFFSDKKQQQQKIFGYFIFKVQLVQ